MQQLEQRTAFITGGAQGIGLGIARALAARGVRLALADIDAEALARARDELVTRTPTETFVLDVRDRDAFAAVADDVERALGPVSLLFNNAGVAGEAPVGAMTYELWDWCLGINLHGVVNGVQTFLPRLLARGGDAYIVNTASGAGLVAAGAGVMYTTAKFAVVGMSEALRRELAKHGIGVSVLCPGYVATRIVDHSAALSPMSDSADDESHARREVIQARMLRRGVDPDVVGELVIDAIRAQRLYVYTDDMLADMIRQRNQELIDALAYLPQPS